MGKKVIAIGNRLMMDDAVGVLVAENIKKELEKNHIEVILGETDVDYAFSMLNKYDDFYILDAVCYGNAPGTIVLKNIEDIKKTKTRSYAVHSLSLIDLINLYKLNVNGYMVGIEIENVCINYGISNTLKERFNDISKEVLSLIIG